MITLNHHIFVCSSFRPSGEVKGKCHKKGAIDFLPYIENELIDRGLSDILVTGTGCLKGCDEGPIMIIYPDNLWYGNLASTDQIDEILDALEDGQVVQELLINKPSA